MCKRTVSLQVVAASAVASLDIPKKEAGSAQVHIMDDGFVYPLVECVHDLVNVMKQVEQNATRCA